MRYIESAEAKCPFYHKESPHRVFCEGVVECSSLSLNFGDPKVCQEFRFKYCNSNYKDCPVNKMLMKKYM